MKSTFTILFNLIVGLSFAQYEYEPSKKHPYGLPNPDAPKQIQDFAPMIGVCDCLSESRNADKTWNQPVKMTWTFKYIMNGMAVQDETLKEDGRHSGSIRQYSQDSARWYVHYYASASPGVAPLSFWEGKKEENKIVLYRPQKAPNGMDGFYRLTFSEMDEKGFKWVGEWVNTAETFTYPTWKIDCKRK